MMILMGTGTGNEGEDRRRAAVVEVMARIAAGERSAVWELHTLAQPALTRILRAEARRIDFRIGDEDVFDLTLDAAIELGKLARSWDPDGALPWVWARRRIVALVHGHIGVFADELDDTVLDIAAASSWASVTLPREALRALARSHPAARQLDRGLEAVTERDADIYLRVQLEKGAGNHSPAVTIGVECDMRPDAVRKVVQRVLARLEDVA